MMASCTSASWLLQDHRCRSGRISTFSECGCSLRTDCPQFASFERNTQMSLKTIAVAIAGLTMTAFATSALAAEISGAGATFPYPIYAKWAAAYRSVSGVALNYQSIGSGGGIAQIKAKTVTFGATDMPLKPKDLDAAGLVMFPTVIGAEVIVYNLSGIASNTLV